MERDYIETEGLLEQYILGDLDEATRTKLEASLEKEPKLKEELLHIEHDFERLNLENALEVPPLVKQSLLTAIKRQSSTSKEIHIKPNKYKAWFSLAAAASVILFLNTIFLIVQNGDIKYQLSTLQNQSQELENNQERLRTAYNNQGELLAFLSDPDTEAYLMKGNDVLPETQLVSYLNHKDKKVMVNTSQLSELDAQHDYQMWADVEGEMINMGVINTEEPLIAMTYIEDAESLNVTIEPKGGSDHPTVSRLITNVYLN